MSTTPQKRKARFYTVEVLSTINPPDFSLCYNQKFHLSDFHVLTKIQTFHVFDYKNVGEARYAAGKFAVGIDKDQCRVFVLTWYDKGSPRSEEVTEYEQGILK